MYPRPTEVHYLGDYRLTITFEDGVQAQLDFSPLTQGSGVFRTLQDTSRFAEVRIDAEAETLVWPGGADVCPDVLYHLATAAPLPGELERPIATLVRLTRPAVGARS
jgi:hypothetical protein